MEQAPNPDGIRRTRWAVIRNSYPELKSTTIKTWQEWIPDEVCKIKYDTPINGHIFEPLADGTIVDMEVYFVSLDREQDLKKVLGMELTGAWVNEAREMRFAAIEAVMERCGRFPPKADGAPITWTGLIADTNPPGTDSWWYRLSELERPAGFEFWRQPGALKAIRDGKGNIVGYQANPEAENVKHQQLGFSYWMRQVSGRDPAKIWTQLCGEYGQTFDGKPVYDGIWQSAWHVSHVPLDLYRGIPIWLGWDFGLTPACVVGQVGPTGQLRILREFWCERGGIKQFATDVVKPALTNLFPGLEFWSIGDPAGSQAMQADSELTCLGMLAAAGIPTIPAPSNLFNVRREAVISRLTRLAGADPAIILDPSCRMLIEGFDGGYHFKRVQVGGTDRYHDAPDKNKFSHLHDAIQYLILGVDHIGGGDMGMFMGTANQVGPNGQVLTAPTSIGRWNGMT